MPGARSDGPFAVWPGEDDGAGEDLLQRLARSDLLQNLVRPESLPRGSQLAFELLGADALVLETGLGVDALALRLLGAPSKALLVRYQRLLHVKDVLHLALREAEDLAAVVDGEVAAVLDGDVAERDGLLFRVIGTDGTRGCRQAK